MDQYKLGEIYALATSRISDELTALYESLFDDDGQPMIVIDDVNERIKKFQRQVGYEADLIRQAIREHNND
jgi:Mg2+ and Co2+ transporter CorA